MSCASSMNSSWLPRMHVHPSWRSVSSTTSGRGPSVATSPRQMTSSTPTRSMSSSTAASATALACRSEIRATRMIVRCRSVVQGAFRAHAHVGCEVVDDRNAGCQVQLQYLLFGQLVEMHDDRAQRVAVGAD